MKTSTKKLLVCAIAMLLVIVMFISSIPFSVLKVFADEIKKTVEENQSENVFVQTDKLETKDINDNEALNEAYIINEKKENRTLNSKEFVMSDGTVVVQYFAQNVHYLDGETFEEIDNTLVEVKNEDGESVYENTANFYKVKLRKDFAPNETLIEMENGEHELGFTYIEKNAKTTMSTKHGDSKKAIDSYKGKKLKRPKEFTTGEGKVSYNNISDNIDIHYEVKDNGVKENIVLKSYLSDYDFDFKISAKNLNLQKNEDGSIRAIDKFGNEKFVIPAPFMYDANNEYNYEVHYELSKIGNDYFLTISADEEWIEKEAKLPVTIDPIVETINDTSFSYVNVYEQGTGAQSNTEVYVGEMTGGNKSNAYFRFNLGSKGANYALVNASVRYHHRTEGMGIFSWKNIKYSVNVVDSEMPLANITYANKPERLQYLGTLGADTNVGSTEETHILDFDVNTIKDDVLTIGFEREANNTSGGYVRIFTTGTNGIYLTLRFMPMTGLDESYSMESSEINGATAYVNKADGGLTLNCDLASVNTLSNLPLEASLAYNDAYNDIFTELGVSTYFGNNIKLNFQQFVREEINEYITLYDADGSISTLTYDALHNVYKSADTRLTAGIVGSRVTIFDDQSNMRVFDNGRLYQIYKGEEVAVGTSYVDYITINYASSTGNDANKITSVSFFRGGTHVADSEITFSYSSAGRVSSVKTYKSLSEMVTYTLSYDSSGNLIKVTNTSAGVDIYDLSYDAESRLESVFNKDNQGMYLIYEQYSDRVTEINQVMGTNIVKARWFDRIEFNYSTHSSLTETNYYENGCKVSTSYTAFDVLRNPISEWAKESNGRITGLNRGRYSIEYKQDYYHYDYTKEDVYFEEKINTTFANYVNLNSGQTASGSVNSSSGISQDAHYKYGLTFFAESTANMDLTVTFGGQSKQVVLKNGGKLYITLPCGYISSGTFTIKNNSSSSYPLKISKVTYNVIDYVQEVKTYGEDLGHASVYSAVKTTSYNKKGEYEQKIYDAFQRLTSVEKNSIEDNVTEKSTYTYESSTDFSRVYHVKNIITTRNGAESRREENTYSPPEEIEYYETSTITTANGIKKKKSQRTEYNTNGFFVTETDENNVATTKTYDILNGDVRLKSVVTGNMEEQYGYDYLGNITSTKLVDANGNEILASTNAYSDGIITSHAFGGKTFSKEYYDDGFIQNIKHGATAMLSYEYVADKANSYDDYLSSVTYANGNIESYTYNNNATTVSYKGSATSAVSDSYTYNYDNVNRLASSSYSKNGTELLSYNYGDLNSTTQSTLTIGGELSYGALFTTNQNDVLNRITSTSDKFTKNGVDTIYNVSCAYNNKGQIMSNSIGTYNSTVTYDAFDRLNGYVAKNGTTSVINKSFVYDTYTDNGVVYSTDRIKSITDNLHSGNNAQSTFDAKGFITSAQYNGKTYNYAYDLAGRLSSETIDNVTTTYNYNNYNSITSISGGGKNISYTYDSLGRLTQYTENGTATYFSYDALGNPILYKGTTAGDVANMVWTQGRKLESGIVNNNTFIYTYDMNGMRYKKWVNGNVTEYYLIGSTILAENRKIGTTDNLIYYIYDMMGVSGMIYNGQTYYYEKNTLGDIVGIRNSAGTQVASYTYDAWGNILTKSGDMADINPFRYRGYYYDNETGFYYLQTRYYDPTIRQFINADNYELIGTLSQTIGQLNMYAYANNNPIMFTDETGESIFILLGAIIGGAIVGSVAISNGLTGWNLVGAIAVGMLFGGVLGAGIGALPGLGASIGSNFAFGSGVMTASVSGSQLLAGVATLAGMGIMFAELPKHGGPKNGTLSNDNSIGYYDGDGNLTERYDFKGKPHFIKELQGYRLPHTHHYRWRLAKGIWQRIKYWITG